MPMDHDLPAFDDLVDAVTARLADRLPGGPFGDPQQVPGLEPRIPLMPIPEFFTGARLRVTAVEFTQSAQYHGAGGSRGPDPVPLVAYKPMVARVYARVERGWTGADTLTGSRVTGELTLSVGDRVVYRTAPTRRDGVRVGKMDEVSRTLWDQEITAFGGGIGRMVAVEPVFVNCPLNFEVPAYWCKRGRMHAAVRLWPVNDGPTSSRAVTHTEFLHLLDVPAPKVCLVRVNWVDAAGTTFSPTDQEMLDSMRLATRMLPFPYFETTILGVEQTKQGNFGAPVSNGACNAAWNDLLEDLDNVRIWTRLFGLGDIVYGMVPRNTIPASGSFNSGCGDVSGGGFVEDETTFAHELGHLYDARHVFVTGDPRNEPNYPKYKPRRSIGEVGIDIGTRPPTLFDPDDAIDIMAYPTSGEPQWISPFTYEKILDNRWLQASEPVDPSRVRSVLILGLRIHREVEGVASIDIRKAALVEAAGPLPKTPEGAHSPISIDFLDAHGGILATHHCTWTPRRACGGRKGCCGGPGVELEREPWLDVTEAIEWPGEVSQLAFHRGGRSLHTIDVGEAPDLSIEGPERSDEHLTVYVSARHPRDEVSVVVLFSNDDGLSGQPIAYDPPDGQVTVAIEHLPGGPSCRFRAIATAELSSATADTNSFDLPPTPRRLFLDVPTGPCHVGVGQVPLGVTLDTRGLGAPSPEEIHWESSINGDLGVGYVITPSLDAGEHTVVVTAPDGLGSTLSRRAIIIVGGRGS